MGFPKIFHIFVTMDKTKLAEQEADYKGGYEDNKIELERFKLDLEKLKIEYDREKEHLKADLEKEKIALEARKLDMAEKKDEEEKQKKFVQKIDPNTWATIACTILSIILVGHFEEFKVLSQKMFSFVIKPRIR